MGRKTEEASLLTERSGERSEGSRGVNSLDGCGLQQRGEGEEEREGERKREPTDGGFGKARATPVLQKPVWKERRPPKHLSHVDSRGPAAGKRAAEENIRARKKKKNREDRSSLEVLTAEDIWCKRRSLPSVRRKERLIFLILGDGNSVSQYRS